MAYITHGNDRGNEIHCAIIARIDLLLWNIVPARCHARFYTVDIDNRGYGQDIITADKTAHFPRTFQRLQITRRGKHSFKTELSLVRKACLSLPFGSLRRFKIITLEIFLNLIGVDIIHLRRTQNFCKRALARTVRPRKNDDFRLLLHVFHHILPV